MFSIFRQIPKTKAFIKPCIQVPILSQFHKTPSQPIWPLFVGCGCAVGCLAAKHISAQRYRSRGEGSTPYMFTNYYQGGFESNMTKREACLILGVKPGSNSQRIKAAHKRLLLLNHPDKGGSTFVAAKLNEAKDLLLGNTNSRK